MVAGRRIITILLLVVLLLPAIAVVVDEDGRMPGREFRQGPAKVAVTQISFHTGTSTEPLDLHFGVIQTVVPFRFRFLAPPSQVWLNRFLLARYKSHSNFV